MAEERNRQPACRAVSAILLVLALVGACSGGSTAELDDLEAQADRADEALSAVGTRLQTDFDGTTTGPGRARFGPCGPPSDRVSYRARVTWRSLVGSDEEVVAAARSVVEDLGWRVREQPDGGLRAERGEVSARLAVGPAATVFSAVTDCVGVPDPDEVTDRPETTFDLG